MSVLSSTSTDSSLARVLELENQLKITELKMEFELRLKNQEMENILKIKNLELENCKLTFQLQAKELENIVLNKILESQKYQPVVQAPVQLQAPVQAPVVQVPVQIVQAPVVQNSPKVSIKKSKIKITPEEDTIVSTEEPIIEIPLEEGNIPTLKNSKLDPIEYLNKYYVEAVKIQECNKLVMDSTYNKYIEEICANGVDKIILPREFCQIKEYVENPSDNAVKIAKSFFGKLEPEEIPFYFNKSKKDLYLKTDDGWLLDNEQNSEKIHKSLLLFIKNVLMSVQFSACNTDLLYKKFAPKFYEKYELNYFTWHEDNTSEFAKYLSPSFDTNQDEVSAVKKMKLLMKSWS